MKELLQVYFILGSNNTDRDPLIVLEEALQGGVTLFQFREKGDHALQADVKVTLAQQMKELCHRYNVPFIVNDDVSLALDIGADGVHVGQDDMSITDIKKRCPEDWIVGVSATNQSEAEKAVADGADYIGVGPIFGTNTKKDAKRPIGLSGVKQIRAVAPSIPIVAIGGIQLTDVIPLMKVGADGVSIISAISQSEKPMQATQAFARHASYFHQGM
ncbi:thiamine-phosphate pyrophosphorylase [Gracilibacillus halophilus YIM-C55.5]|uniref:Thiamine-phosphate synthase n=1 Tax=Gracilibacillus halophilus YIM-C55.5 TaxID=1308866 RepID=N4W874_9BACI|nr:thiamine phosphate synthase [Gracilibacillus halophilus]ENH96473.1 thiamine-phosphate pyrophosphorylase [Gracilibacillus halophilus YIM-C55.5]